MLPVFAAIAVAHDEGVIHRDLKPENIFLARERHGRPEPKVLDFGISKISSSGGNTLALTGTGASMGTPYYIAPEQVRSAAGVDARSDQYALGAILYECVTGQRAHRGETIYEVIRSVGEGSFPPPRVHRPDIPPELESAILRAMGLDPAQRFSSVRAFGRAISAARHARRAREVGACVRGGRRRRCGCGDSADRLPAGGNRRLFDACPEQRWGRLRRAANPFRAPGEHHLRFQRRANHASPPEPLGIAGGRVRSARRRGGRGLLRHGPVVAPTP